MLNLEELSEQTLYDINIKYPDVTDDDIQLKLYQKKELFDYRIKHRPDIKNYQELKAYRDLQCHMKNVTLAEQQIMLSKYFNINSSRKGILIFHGLGSGKTCTAISIAESFKKQVIQYNTKIHILVPGPTIKKSWQNELIKCTNGIYHKVSNSNDGFYDFNEFYKIMSFKGFNKRVLGEKIKNFDSDIKGKYQRDDRGDFARTTVYNRIENLSNTLLIIDEAHNITGNSYYIAIKKIINNSSNLKILLLTGTPMKNLASDIIDLINLLRPSNNQIIKSKVFNTTNVQNLNFIKGGKEYLQECIKGYVSYFKGGDDLIFAQPNYKGIVSKFLKFTKIIPCKFSNFHQKIYDRNKLERNSAIEQATNNVVNFVLPYYDIETDQIEGVNGTIGVNNVINLLKTNGSRFNKKLRLFLEKETGNNNIHNRLIYLEDNVITGAFLKEEYLHIFSTKFHKALCNINKLTSEGKGLQTAFIYSNLVTFGINMFKQILKQNGYLEFDTSTQKTTEKTIESTRCYYCGRPFIEHQTDKTKKNHAYAPAVFISVTGEDKENDNADDSKTIITNIFNSSDNYQGKYIKFVLGSKVLSEGFNMKNVGEVHILDTWFNFARMEQVIGRAIRRCSHYELSNELNPYPKVNVYKYCVTIDDNEPSSEELLYQIAEKKHILIKEIERMIKENAFDCALNYEGNRINKPEYNNCVPITFDTYDIVQLKSNEQFCSVECDYQKCSFKCSNTKLNKDFYDEKKVEYKTIPSKELDLSTYSLDLSQEITLYKQKIKNLFILKYVYTLEEIVEKIKNTVTNFDIYCAYKALDELIPQSENEFNNFIDFIIDKYNRLGYLIYVNKYYIFQPINTSENEPMNYRINQYIVLNNNITLFDYLEYNSLIIDSNIHKEINKYDFDAKKDYYLFKKEFDYVGIIDKEPNRKKNKTNDELNDIFRLRKAITIKSNKKRETGLQTYNGSVCFNSYSMSYIKTVFNKFNLQFDPKLSRSQLCNILKEHLIEQEKYNEDNITYLIIPCNHPIFPFPLNLKDRTIDIKNKLLNELKENVLLTITKNKNKSYTIMLQKTKITDKHEEFILNLGFIQKNKNNYELIVD